MKWTFSIQNKLKASLTLLLLCGVVLFSNYRLKKLSARVAASVQTIYEDRLLVQDLIFSFDAILDILDNDAENVLTQGDYNRLLTEFEGLILSYQNTILTEEEKRLFMSFTVKLKEALTRQKVVANPNVVQMKEDLHRLEKIQLEEAQNQMNIIQQASKTSELGFYIETAVLVVLLLIVQVLVMSNLSIQKLTKRAPTHLNN